MQYSNTTAKDGIMQMIEQTTGVGDTAITGVIVKKAYFNNLINNWYRTAAYIAWKADKNWSFDDTTQTTFPQFTTTLVNNQRDYTLPSTALRLRGVEVMDLSGYYYTVKYMHEDDPRLLSMKEQEVAGVPTHYRLVGNSVILYPKPNTAQVTATLGLRTTLDREVVAFVVGDTTKEPGLPAQFHPILYYGPSYEWAMLHSVPGVAQLCENVLGKIPGLLEMAGTFFAERNQDNERSIRRKGASYR